MPQNNNNEVEENAPHEDVREVPPGLSPEVVGNPKKSQIQDLLPVLGKYTIEDIKNNKEAIGMIVQLLLDKSEEVNSLKNETIRMRDKFIEKSVDYTSERTKLSERWKSQLCLQLISFLSALALCFSFQFKPNENQFWLLLIIGVISGLGAVIGPFVINKSEPKSKAQ